MKRGIRRRFAGAAFFATLLPLFFSPLASAQDIASHSAERLLTVERLACRGNNSTSCDFILGQVYLAVGDPVDEREIREATLRLSWLRNFDSVSIYLEKGTERGRAVVIVEVTEARPLEYQASLGLYSRTGDFGANLGAGLTHYNLFGKGRILDFHAGGFRTLEGAGGAHGTSASLEYIDPHLFGTKRLFMQAGVGYQNQRNELENGDVFDVDALRINLSYGLRLWSFSYITAGYQLRPTTDIFTRRLQNDGTVEVRTPRNHGGPTASFGWNTEDDSYFPTRGSQLNFGYFRSFTGRDDYTFSYRKNWRMGGEGVWTVAIEPDASLVTSYSRMIDLRGHFNDVRRARWRVSPFVRPYYNNFDGSQVWETGISASLLLETRSFGIVSFSLFGSGTFTSGGRN
jgi:outer membrane protein assembly factor BamA